MKSARSVLLLSLVTSLAACATTPMGPTVLAVPKSGKPFGQFQNEDGMCRQYADERVGGQAETANSNGLLEGIGGTVLGAGLGAALGGGGGAAIGAAGGALAGTAVGSSTSSQQQWGIQEQYNNAYVQCMVSNGNQIQQPPPRPVIYAAPPPVVYAPPPVIYAAPPPVYAPYPY
ncbi:MAG: glycine zipper family protein [Pseudomonadota bacterium]|nr:glycine zipper family protein [Pseudomonadota bacterium]